MTEVPVKLIGEYSVNQLPSFVENLILNVKAELGETLTDRDLTVVILFGLMVETGFTPLAVDSVPSVTTSPVDLQSTATFDARKLKAIRKMPNNWRNSSGSTYSMKFSIDSCPNVVCQFLASKIEAGANTIAIDDSLIVNVFLNCSPNAQAINIQPSRYVTTKDADIPDMFTNLDELSLIFKEIAQPLRNTLLEEYGKLNASLLGLPTEVKLKIFKYMSVPDDWNVLSKTCMDLHILANDENLWKFYLKRDFGSDPLHRAEVDEMRRYPADINWKTEYVGRYVRAFPNPSVLRGCPGSHLVARSSRSAATTRSNTPETTPPVAVALVTSFDSDAWTESSDDEVTFDLADWRALGSHLPDRRFQVDDIMRRYRMPIAVTPSPMPSVHMLYVSNTEDGGFDSGHESDGELEVIPTENFQVDDPSVCHSKETLEARIREYEANRASSSGASTSTNFDSDLGAESKPLRFSNKIRKYLNGPWFGPYASVTYSNDVRGYSEPFCGAKTVKRSWASTRLAAWAGPDDAKRFASITVNRKVVDFKEEHRTFSTSKALKALQEAERDRAEMWAEMWAYMGGTRSLHSSPGMQDLRKLDYDTVDEATTKELECGGIATAVVDSCAFKTEFKTFSTSKVLKAEQEAERDSDSWDYVLGTRSLHSSRALQDLSTLKSRKDNNTVDEATAKEFEDRRIATADVDYTGENFTIERSRVFLNSDALLLPKDVTSVTYPFKLNDRPLLSEGSDDPPRSEEVLNVEYPFELNDRPLVVEESVGRLSEDVSGVNHPFDFDFPDVDSVSMRNNIGSELDLIGVSREVESNGDGDGGYLEGVVPSEYSYKEVRPGEPYV